MCRNDKKLLKYQVALELYGNVGPFEPTEADLAEQKSKEEEYEAALKQFDEAMDTYNFDDELYEKQKEEYDKQ
jgi:hypothetical protein